MTLVTAATLGDLVANQVNGLNSMSPANLAILKTYWEAMAQGFLGQGIGGFSSYNIVQVTCQHGVQASVAHGMPSAPTLGFVIGCSGGLSPAGLPVLADLGSGNLGVTLRYGFTPQVISASLARASGIAPASATWADVTSISVPAGSWMLSGNVVHTADGSIVGTDYVGGISSTSGNSGTGLLSGQNLTEQIGTPTTACWTYCVVQPYYVTPTVTTTYYLKTNTTYSSGTPKIFGTINAQKIDAAAATSATVTLMLLQQ